METFSALLASCAGNSPVPGEFPAQRPVTRSFDVFFDLSPNTRSGKQWWGWWFETPSGPLWRHCNGLQKIQCYIVIIQSILFKTHYKHPMYSSHARPRQYIGYQVPIKFKVGEKPILSIGMMQAASWYTVPHYNETWMKHGVHNVVVQPLAGVGILS